MEATKDAWRSLTDKWSSAGGRPSSSSKQLLDFNMSSSSSSSAFSSSSPSAESSLDAYADEPRAHEGASSSSSSAHHQSAMSSFTSSSSPPSSASSSLFSTLSSTLKKKSSTVAKKAAATATSAAAAVGLASSYERTSAVEGELVRAGYVIYVTGWQAVWPGLNRLELTTTGIRLLSEEQRLKSELRIEEVEAVGAHDRNPLLFFVRGRAPSTVTWMLETHTAHETADWIAAILNAMASNHGVRELGDDLLAPSSHPRRSRAATAPPAPLFHDATSSPQHSRRAKDHHHHHHHHHNHHHNDVGASQALSSLQSDDDPFASEFGPLGVTPIADNSPLMGRQRSNTASGSGGGGLLLDLTSGEEKQEQGQHQHQQLHTSGETAELIRIALPSASSAVPARRARAHTFAAPRTAVGATGASPPASRRPTTTTAHEAAWDPFGDALLVDNNSKLSRQPSSPSSMLNLPAVPSPTSPKSTQDQTFNFLD